MKSEYHIVHKRDGRTIEWWGDEISYDNFHRKDKLIQHITEQTGKLVPLFHRDVGPAIIKRTYKGFVIYTAFYVQNSLHRITGPAENIIDKGIWTRKYFLCGKLVSKENFYTPGFIDAFILENS